MKKAWKGKGVLSAYIKQKQQCNHVDALTFLLE